MLGNAEIRLHVFASYCHFRHKSSWSNRLRDLQPPTMITRQLLTHYEAAELLSISDRELLRLVNANELPHVRLPNQELRFDQSDLWRWIDSLKSNQNANPGSHFPTHVTSIEAAPLVTR